MENRNRFDNRNRIREQKNNWEHNLIRTQKHDSRTPTELRTEFDAVTEVVSGKKPVLLKNVWNVNKNKKE